VEIPISFLSEVRVLEMKQDQNLEDPFEMHDIFTFVIEESERRMLASKSRFIACSPVLKCLFAQNPQLDEVVVPPQFSHSAIRGLIRYSFGERLEVKTKDLLDMRAAAIHYQIDTIVKCLDEKIKRKTANEKYFCCFFHSACKSNNSTLVDMYLDLFQRMDHNAVILSKYFLCLDYEDLCLIFRKNTLHVNPDLLMDRLQDWVKYSGSSSPDRTLGKVTDLVANAIFLPSKNQTAGGKADRSNPSPAPAFYACEKSSIDISAETLPSYAPMEAEISAAFLCFFSDFNCSRALRLS